MESQRWNNAASSEKWFSRLILSPVWCLHFISDITQILHHFAILKRHLSWLAMGCSSYPTYLSTTLPDFSAPAVKMTALALPQRKWRGCSTRWGKNIISSGSKEEAGQHFQHSLGALEEDYKGLQCVCDHCTHVCAWLCADVQTGWERFALPTAPFCLSTGCGFKSILNARLLPSSLQPGVLMLHCAQLCKDKCTLRVWLSERHLQRMGEGKGRINMHFSKARVKMV